MNDDSHAAPATPPPSGHDAAGGSRRRWIADVIQLVVSLVVVGAALFWLLKGHQKPAEDQNSSAQTAAEPPAKAVGQSLIDIRLDTTLGKKLTVETVKSEKTQQPLMRATGTVLASRRPGLKGTPDFWQFSTSELLNSFTAWERAMADTDFAESQLGRIRELADTKERALEVSIARLEKLVKAGTETERDLATQKAQLLETQIGNRKDIYEADTALKTARRQQQALTLQLQQSGLDPQTLENAKTDLDIVAAEVPEGRLKLISVGQSCTARFFGLPDHTFTGKLTRVSPVLSSEQRTLRVLFELFDPKDQLRPGMFADVGLGTDEREALWIPASAVIHIGRTDYVLAADSAEGTGAEVLHLKVLPVVVQELSDGRVEVESGISSGQRIVIQNAILLKPVAISSLSTEKSTVVSHGANGTKS